MTTKRESLKPTRTMPFLGVSNKVADEQVRSSGSADRLRMLCTLGLEDQESSAKNRLDHELAVIHQLGLDDFFLALVDIHRFATSRGHVMTLEGPAAGSLVVHLLGLSPVNPLHHRLLFERFLDPDQTFAPSRQFGISEGGQVEVVGYARAKFGWDDAEKHDRPYRAYCQEWQSPSAGKPDRATIDVVVHPGLTVLKRTVALIREGNGFDEIPIQLPDNDEKTLALFRRGETEDIDQFRTSCAQELLRKLKPEGIDDLAIACSLSHEVQFKNGVATEYFDQRASQRSSSYPHPWLKDILGETHGVLLYHEQVMGIVHRLGGLELRDGVKLLKAVCKSSQEKIDEFQKRFVTGAEEKKIDPDVANSIFDSIVRGAGHTTCKTNNTIAATIAYQLAYLKANHDEAFTAADAEGTYAAFDEALLADLTAHHPEALAAADAG